MSLPTIRPLRTNDELNELIKLANADEHLVVDASHLVQKDGQTIGYLSLGKSVMVNVWMDTKKVTASDSLHILNSMEAMLADKGASHYLMPCTPTSPYAKVMDKLGFKSLGDCIMHVKALFVAQKPQTASEPLPFPKPEPEAVSQ